MFRRVVHCHETSYRADKEQYAVEILIGYYTCCHDV